MKTVELRDLDLETMNSFAISLASKLKGGEVIVLSSDLGGGKTTLTKAIVKGLGSDDDVTSPSFTIVNEYDAKFRVYHFDFYRLSDPGIIAHQLSEVAREDNSVTIIEWADIVEDVLPNDYIRIEIMKTNEDKRDIKMFLPESREYLAWKYFI